MEKLNSDELVLEYLRDFLTSQGYYNLRVVPGRGICGLQEFIFTIGLCAGINKIGYEDRWCYPKENIMHSIVAITIWDGKEDPIGDWIKYKGKEEEYGNPNVSNENNKSVR